jgi:hypothetical protein
MEGMKKLLAAMFVALLMVGCGEDEQVHIDQDEAGDLSDNVYHNKRVGWSMEIPDGWDIVSKEANDETFSRGKKFSEDGGVRVDYSGMKSLIALEKTGSNLTDEFMSMTQDWVIKEDDRVGFVDGQMQALLSVFRNQGAAPEASEVRRETIDGISFNLFDVKINQVRQTYYFAFFDSYYFGAILTYTSIDSREELLKAWRGSKFRQ